MLAVVRRINMGGYRYITFEGIEGIGKTFLLRQFIEKHGTAKYFFVGEELEGFAEEIFSVLNNKDLFYRHGNPVAEMLCFFAIDLCGIKEKVLPALAEGKLVLQDRGADSACLYAAIELFMKGEIRENEIGSSYRRFFEIRKQLGKMPDLTIVLIGDFETAIKRAENRDGREYTKEEIHFLKTAHKWFRKIAEMYPERIRVVELEGKSTTGILEEILRIINREIINAGS